jgi:hypothetical protein
MEPHNSLRVGQMVKESPTFFLEKECSLPHSQQPVISPHPKTLAHHELQVLSIGVLRVEQKTHCYTQSLHQDY